MITRWLTIFLVTSISTVEAKLSKEKSKRFQEINFEEMSVQGLIRQPTAEFIIQKPEGKYVPVLRIKQDFDKQLRNSADWVR